MQSYLSCTYSLVVAYFSFYFFFQLISIAFLTHQVVMVEWDAPEDDVEHQKYRQVDYFPSIVHPARIIDQYLFFNESDFHTENPTV